MPFDYSRIHRLLAILTHLQSGCAGGGGAWTAAKLAREFDVTERTIYRDLDVLRGAGIPCDFDEDAGGYRVRRDYFLPPVDLTPKEALALVAIGEQVAHREQIPLLGAAFSAIAKVRCNLPADLQDEVAGFGSHVAIDLAAAGPHEGYDDVYEKVRGALAARRVLLCRYESVRSTIERAGDDDLFELRPYTLFFGQRAWYVIGHHGRHDEIRCLKLNRFSTVNETDRPYAVPDGFSLRSYLGNAWRMIPGEPTYDVELRFDALFAETIDDTRWHETQETDLDEKTGTLTFRCTVDGLDEIKWWVLGMGPHCLVVSPPELAREVEALARGVVARYEASDEARHIG